MRVVRFLLLAVCLLAPITGFGQPAPAAVIEFFHEPGCAACQQVETEILPAVALRYGDLVEVRKVSLAETHGDVRLLRYLDRFGTKENARVFVVVNGRDCLAGLDAIRTGLLPMLDQHLSQGITPDLLNGAPEPTDADSKRLARRVEAFTLGGVILGGLIDGVNPCALATLVFLLSVLGMARVSGRELLMVGGVFCLASFMTYVALGFGLLGALHLLDRLALFRRILDGVMIVVLVGLALLSLRDAWLFARTSHAHRMLLRLPTGIQQRVHRLVRSRLAKYARLPTVFVVGVLVTGLESVCTGQVYIPTLVLVMRGGRHMTQAAAYLVVYNVMFILPLIVTMLLAAGGMQWTCAAEWSRRHVVSGKLLLTLFFLLLAVVLYRFA